MNINIYLEDTLHKKLTAISKKRQISRNRIIRIAIYEWLVQHEKKEWPKDFFKIEGMPDFPSAEELRKGLTPPREDPLS